MAKPKALTATVLEKTKVAPGDAIWIADAQCRGLRVRIANTAQAGRTVTFYYRYRDRRSGKLKSLSMGQLSMKYSLADARGEVNQELRPLAESGVDVRRHLKQQQAESQEQARQTVRALIPDYLTYIQRRGLSEGTVASYRRYLRPLAVWWGDVYPREISRGDVQDLFDRVKSDGVPPFDVDGVTPIEPRGKVTGGHRAAGLTLAAGRAYWGWLLDRELVESNPWKDQKKLTQESQSGTATRALDDKEISAVLDAATTTLNSRDLAALKFMLGTGLRPNEVCAAEWKEIDLKAGVWVVPADRMKYKKADHTVYLSGYVLDALKAWRHGKRGRPRYVFPSDGTERPHLVPDNLVERFKRLGVTGFTPKVCRATVRTGLQRLGCPEEVRARISHHQRGDKVARSYDHHRYDNEARHWWEQWGLHLAKVAQGEDGLAEVINIKDAV